MLVFQLFTRQYECASTILTSNKGFEDWNAIFGDEVLAPALIDPPVRHCEIVNIRDNYRLRQHAELARRLHTAPPPATERRLSRQEATAGPRVSLPPRVPFSTVGRVPFSTVVDSFDASIELKYGVAENLREIMPVRADVAGAGEYNDVLNVAMCDPT